MKKYIAAIVIIALAASGFWYKVAHADTIDATNHTGSTMIGFGDTLNGRDYMCQGFVMATFNQITAVAFYINGKNSDTNFGRKVWIDNADASSNPTGSVGVGIGGGTEITNATLVTGALTKYTLTTTVNVTIGNKYALCIAPWNTTTHVWTSDYQDFASSTANPYAPAAFSGAKRVHLDGSFLNPSAPDAGNDDIQFDIYGVTAASGATQHPALNINNKGALNLDNKGALNIGN